LDVDGAAADGEFGENAETEIEIEMSALDEPDTAAATTTAETRTKSSSSGASKFRRAGKKVILTQNKKVVENMFNAETVFGRHKQHKRLYILKGIMLGGTTIFLILQGYGVYHQVSEIRLHAKNAN
tara:strand:+ start:88 stop:465 length:378 start_codon:yes stop_codon:yes gene_type:complete